MYAGNKAKQSRKGAEYVWLVHLLNIQRQLQIALLWSYHSHDNEEHWPEQETKTITKRLKQPKNQSLLKQRKIDLKSLYQVRARVFVNSAHDMQQNSFFFQWVWANGSMKKSEIPLCNTYELYIYIKSQIVLLYNFAHFSPLKNNPSIYWPQNVKLGERPYNVICQIFSMASPLQGTVLLLASSKRIQH